MIYRNQVFPVGKWIKTLRRQLVSALCLDSTSESSHLLTVMACLPCETGSDCNPPLHNALGV